MLASLSPSTVLEPRITAFTLENGMDVIVIPDHRAPIVTHMVWYRAGAADAPSGASGVAHFLEHLMFKGTKNIASGEFSRIVSRLGGQGNAFTAQDVTVYHQRVARDRLRTVMELEADRMFHLRFTDEEFETERQVIIEEQRSRVENNPGARLGERMNKALYGQHPYGTPVIGWLNEIRKLSRDDALDFYKRHYAPDNAVLVVSGDVTPGEVRNLADDTYGNLPKNPEARRAQRPPAPVKAAVGRVALEAKHVSNPSFHRMYVAPSYRTAKPLEAEALELLLFILTQGPASRLHRNIIVDRKLATSVGGSYAASYLDCGLISISGAAKGGNDDVLEAAIDGVLEEIRSEGVTETELHRAQKMMLNHHISNIENANSRAHHYGMRVALGGTIEQVDGWTSVIKQVTADQVKAVANDYLDASLSATGWLLPERQKGEGVPEPIVESATA